MVDQARYPAGRTIQVRDAATAGFLQSRISKGYRLAAAGRRGLDFIDIFRALADENDQLRLDCTSDGLHLASPGYKIWVERLKPYLARGGGSK